MTCRLFFNDYLHLIASPFGVFLLGQLLGGERLFSRAKFIITEITFLTFLASQSLSLLVSQGAGRLKILLLLLCFSVTRKHFIIKRQSVVHGA